MQMPASILSGSHKGIRTTYQLKLPGGFWRSEKGETAHDRNRKHITHPGLNYLAVPCYLGARMTDYAELRAALPAATPGPWFVHGSLGHAVATVGKVRIASDAHCTNRPEEDATYIAAANPEVIRALLAERDALIHDNAEYVGAASALATENQRLREALRWAAGSLLAACGSGQATELDRFTLDGVTRTGTEILDMADAALAQGQGEE